MPGGRAAQNDALRIPESLALGVSPIAGWWRIPSVVLFAAVRLREPAP
jgi:hypothetical protein